MTWWIIVLSVLAGYLLGSLSMSVIVSELIYKSDVRKHGSGNAGATNMARVYGWKGGLAALVGDIAKALIAMIGAYYMGYIGDKTNAFGVDYMCIAGAACMLGHAFPLYFKFKGGKCVTVGAAVALMVDWRVFLIVVAAFIIVVAITKIVSVSSMAAAFLLPVSYSILGVLKVFELCLPKLILSLFVGVLIIVLHYKNIVRLSKGEEKKFSFKKKSDKE